MSRLLYWALLGGCALLVALFSPLAWQSVLACEFPADCRGELASSELALHRQLDEPNVSNAEASAPSALNRTASGDSVADAGEIQLPMIGTLALGGDLLGGEMGNSSGR